MNVLPQFPDVHGTHRRGSALVLALLMAMVLAAAATLLTDITISRFSEEGRRYDDVALLVSAESAFNEAYAWFQTDPTRLPTVDGLIPVDNDDIFEPGISHNGNTVQVLVRRIYDTDVDTWGDEAYKIIAVAMAGDPNDSDLTKYRRRKVEAIIRPEELTAFKQAMFAKNGYDFSGSAMTDSYDSTNGPYAIPPDQDWLNSNGDIASQGSAVDLNGGVHGEVKSGVDLFMPAFEYDPPAGTVTVVSGAGATGITVGYTFTVPGTFRTGSLVLNGGDVLRIEGGGTVKLYVDSVITLNGGEIQFDSDESRLEIYQNDYVGDTSSIRLNGTTDIGTIVPVAGGATTGPCAPSQLLWVSNCTEDIDLNGTASINAAIMAPNATFRLNGTFDFFGAIIARAFGDATDQGLVNGNFKFHYDESLSGFGPDVIPQLRVFGWYSKMLAVGGSVEDEEDE
jgi:hypothetical protein